MKPCHNCVGGRSELSWIENGKLMTKDVVCEVCNGKEEIPISDYEDYIENMALAKQVKERFEFGEKHGLYKKI